MSYIKCGACGYEREKGLNEKGEWVDYELNDVRVYIREDYILTLTC